LALGNDWWISKEEKSINIEKNIKKSTDLIKDAFKVNPLSFRSPKFSSDKSLNKILLKYGYKIDSSTTPHNGKFLPSINQNLLQIPVSRYYKPKLRLKYGIPFLNYESLMFSNLKTMGVNKFENLTKKIIETFDNKNKVILNFMCHNWDFSTQKDISIVEEYLNNLEKRFKIEFIPLKKYYKKFY